jgi:RNA polymerase sigma-32 factor
MTTHLPVPILKNEGNLAFYLREIKKFPMLEPHEEFMLAKSWRDHGDRTAAHRLVTSHLRLVAKIAMGYRGYGLPISELIAEGNLGMMQAVKRFDPDKGFRLATYAMWWIRAAMQEYILRSWSLVKMGTTAGQKKLFFNLKRLRKDMRAVDGGDLTPEQVQQVSKALVVSEDEVISMDRRLMGPDHSLNAMIRADGEEEWQDWLVDDTASAETTFGEAEELDARQKLLTSAMMGLNAREREIIVARRLHDEPMTLENLSQKYGISRERVRQIEARAFEKLQKNIKLEAVRIGLLPAPDTLSQQN